jgi:hypothetical protein
MKIPKGQELFLVKRETTVEIPKVKRFTFRFDEFVLMDESLYDCFRSGYIVILIPY